MPPRITKGRPQKTNAVRLLESKGLPFELLEYPVDESDLSAERAASLLGLPEAAVYKTLVALGDRTGHVKALIPAGRQLSLKALADATGDKKILMLHVRDLLEVTGYVRGGCSPLGGKLRCPVYILDEALALERMAFNAGRRGLLAYMKPGDFLLAAGAVPAPISPPGEG
ncbi:MAG: aminoacyl-tRNA deacylase [Deltaproteobacteria bacterium]|jgi:Cys-tRNA(Pro)/Cys-tRNA(Cys) deacylase|nr:aminoacyl-tRNA deacylase [Deltaproteobacteria bacterium]